MNGNEVLAFGRDAIWLTIQLCTPILLVGLVVGVAIGLFQGEPFTLLRGVSFAFIWAGAMVFAFGAWRRLKAIKVVDEAA